MYWKRLKLSGKRQVIEFDVQALRTKFAETMKITDGAEPREGTKIADEVRLIEVSIIQRELRPIRVRNCVHSGQNPLKSHDAIEYLRRQAHFGPKDVNESFLAEVGLPSQLTGPSSASSLGKPIQRQRYSSMMLLRTQETRDEQFF